MPAVSSRETIPNFPLNGQELAIYAVKTFERVCLKRDVLPALRDAAVAAFKTACENDWVFKPSFIYANAKIEIGFQSHATVNHETKIAFTLEPVFRFVNINFSECKPFVRRPLGMVAPPLEGYAPEAEHRVDCFTIAVSVENPNLVRVHHGMPITITEKRQPKHGDLFGTIENHEVRYDPQDYEPLPEPVVTDDTDRFVDSWGLRGALLYLPAVGVHVSELREWPVADREPSDEELERLTAPTEKSPETSQDRSAGKSAPSHPPEEIDASTRAESGKDEVLNQAGPIQPPLRKDRRHR
jgi:hypothetical protein